MHKILALVCSVSILFPIFSEEPAVPTKAQRQPYIKNYPSIHASEIKLDNGMTVCLKPTDCEPGEIYLRMAALGGLDAMNPEDWPSAYIATEAAWESGMGSMSSDQVSVLLYENALEFNSKIHPFSRVIEAEGSVDGVEVLFDYIHKIFTRQKFTEQGWKDALKHTKNDIDKLGKDSDRAYETAFDLYNTNDMPVLRPINANALDKGDWRTSEKLFKHCFSNPSEYVCVIVGDFDSRKMTYLVNKYLGDIPKGGDSHLADKEVNNRFPAGISKGEVKLCGKSGMIVRMTFPIKLKINEDILPEIAFACQVIETRLLQLILDKMHLSHGVDVSYEFPMYPLLSDPWVSIRFRCQPNQVQALTNIITNGLKNLQQNGVSQEEVDTMKALEYSHQDFWLQDNSYWVSMLMNYKLWGWNPDKIIYKNSSIPTIKAGRVGSLIKEAISLDHYSIFTGQFSEPEFSKSLR